ncbi:hypothetical protein [Pseudoalteromonas sp. 31A1]|uniref:hypothetical protein n=1 Tax=Pseudoalteromonas sp. 31A1 TaxID=2686351 RepID=UPI0013FDC798|nr:hypothetical protein [Pseudoalteromonas sp. 31A1]
MYYSENIGRILRLFREEHTERNEEYLSNFDSVLKSKVIAELLLNSNIATPELNRENVAKLFSGELAWPKDNGEEYKKNLNVELATLEKLGAVTFYANYCQVHVRSIPEINEIDESCRPLLEALDLLRNIIFGWESFVKPHFKIDKQKAESILAKRSLPCIISDFKERNGYYHLDTLEHDFKNIIAEYLWDSLVNKLALKDEEAGSYRIGFNQQQLNLMSKWLLICRVYSDNYLSQLNFSFISYTHQYVYLEYLELLVASDEQLKHPKSVLDNKWLCSSDIRRVFLDIRSEYSIDINLTASDSKKQNSYKETKTAKSLDDIKESLFTNSNNMSISNLAFYDSYRNLFYVNDTSNFYSSSLTKIINSDVYVDSSSINSCGRLDRLFENSNESHELRFMLLNGSIHSTGVKYLLYLLTKKETATTALYIFANNPLSNSLNLHHKENDSFYLEYFPAVCDEFMDIYSKNFFNRSLVEGEASPSTDIVELLILMAKNSIHNNYAGELNAKKGCLDILMSKFTSEQISDVSVCLLSKIGNDKEEFERSLPVWKFYLLFWLLEKAQDFNLLGGKKISEQTQHIVVDLYCEYFKSCIDNKESGINAYKMFDYLPWWRIDDEYIPEYLGLIEKPNKWANKISNSNDFGYGNKDLIRSYFQLLLGLHTENRKNSYNSMIISKALNLLESFGFSDEDYEIFGYESQYDYPLWRQFTLFVDNLNDDEFNRVTLVLRDEVPLNKVLELYSQLKREARKSDLLRNIGDFASDKTLDKLSIIALEESLDFTCSIGQVDTAKVMLEKGLTLLSDEDSYLNKRLPSLEILRLQDKWKVYEFKVRLLIIVNDANLSDEGKLEEIRKTAVPFKSNRTNQIQQSLVSNCERFRRQMSALVLFTLNPEAAYRYFDGLYRQWRTGYYAGNRFASRLKFLDTNQESTDVEYKRALNEWLEFFNDENIHELDFNIISNWIYCLVKVHDLRGVDALWSKLSKNQQHNILIATSYCHSLKLRGDHYSAQSIFEKLKGYHNVSSLGDEADFQLSELEELIIKDIEPKRASALTSMLANQPRTSDELRQRYYEIKSKKLADLVIIVEEPNSTIESFLYKQLSLIMKEIQLRKNNLNNKLVKGDTPNSYRIINEDSINDWVTSLFDHRLSYIGLNCRDQKRGGRSGSLDSKNPGEIDFFLCGNNNERIAIMEAFRLFSNDTTVINSHLNKIVGYDQESLSPVFIIAYCDVTNFIDLCDKYYKDTKSRDYIGFKKSASQNDLITPIEKSQNLNYFKEVRYRDRKPIVIYHMMINLRF